MLLQHVDDLRLRAPAPGYAVVSGTDSHRGLSESVGQYSVVGQIASPVPKVLMAHLAHAPRDAPEHGRCDSLDSRMNTELLIAEPRHPSGMLLADH